ncbi:MAG: T9SS type A sorting domain-containing protein [bacterium]
MKKILLKLVLCLLLSSSQIVYSQWEPCNKGLNGGSIQSILIKGNNIYLALYSGGVSISTDYGNSWEGKNNGLTNLHVQCLAFNGKDIIAGTWNGGVFISSDNGENWVEKTIGYENLMVNCIVVKDNLIILGTNSQGILVSSDNGETWSNATPDKLEIDYDVTSMVTFGDGIFCAEGASVYLSTDNGLSWTEKINGLVSQKIYTLNTFGNTIYAGTNEGLYYSKNNGDSWHKNLFLPVRVESLAVSDSVIAVASSEGCVYISIDNGISWSKTTFSQFPTSLAISGGDLWAGTCGGIYLSKDLGKNWEKHNQGLNSTQVTGIELLENDIFVSINGNWVYKSTNNGDIWEEKNEGFNLSSPYSSLVNSLALNKNGIFAGTSEDGIYFSSDNGNNWINKSAGLELDYISSIACINNYIFAAIRDYGIYVSTNNGDTWEETNYKNSFGMIISMTVNDNGLYVGTLSEGVSVSYDYGENWVQSGLKGSVYSLISVGNRVYAGKTSGGVFVTSEEDFEWTSIGFNVPYVTVHSLAVVDNYIFAGTDKGIYFTSNNGNSWELKNEGLMDINVIALKIKGDSVFAGTYGGGMYRARISDFIGNGVEDNNINTDNYLYSYPPFPNPATKEVRSLVYWDTSSDIEQDEIGVYNIYGAKVSDRSKITFDKLNLYSGYLVWNCAGIETGVYMIVIKHGTATRTIKVVVN